MASLTNNKIKDTYQSLVKFNDNGNITTSAKRLTDGFGNNSPFFVSTTQIGIGVTPTLGYDLHVNSNAKIGGNLLVSGNLTVSGTLTYIDVEDLATEDPLIKLARNNDGNLLDIGFYGKYVQSTVTKYKGLFNDADDNKWKLFIGTSNEPTTVVNTSGTGYTVGTLVANLEGNVTGTVSSLSNHTTTNLAEGTNLYYTNARADARVNLQTGANLDLSSKDTDDLSEGTTNLYYTNARFDTRFTSKDTDDLSEGTTNLYFTTARARASFTAGTGVTITNGEIAIGQDVSTTSNVTFGNITGSAISGTTGAFSGQVTIPETPTADAHAASKKYVDDSTANVDVAKRLEVTVKNVSGGSLAKGTVVHAAPSASPPSGNVIEVIAADANDAAKMPAIGVLNETIADEAEGEAVMFGAVSGIDTSSFSIGDELYVSTTAGEFTATKPTANDELVQKVAIVIKSHASNGLIKVFGAGRANDVPNQIDRDVNFTDNSKLTFGDSTTPDFRIYHEGTDSIIQNYTGSIYIDNNADNQDIVFRSDNGSGGIIEYFRVDGSTNTVPFGRSPHIVDNVKLYFGNDTANDASIKWDSTASQLFIDGVSKFLDNVYFTSNAYFGDNDKLYFGDLTTPDLQIYHNGTNSFIENETGNLYIFNKQDDGDVFIETDNSSGGTTTYLMADGGTGSLKLFHYGSKKLETTDTGISVTGSITTGRNINLSSTDYAYIQGTHTSAADGEYVMRVFGYGDSNFYGSFDILRHDENDGEIRLRTKIDGTNTNVLSIVDGNSTFAGNVDVDGGQLNVTSSDGLGRIELGGASGGYIDLKAPASDDYDMRFIVSQGGNEITTASGDLKINTANTLALTIDSTQNATFAGTITASGGSSNNNDDANILTLNASEHARLLVDTSSTSGHRATLALESNGNELLLTTTGSASELTSVGNLTVTSSATTFTGSVTANSFIKSGGTSSQYLMADGSVSTSTGGVTGTGVNNRLAIWNGTTAIDSDSDFYVDGDTIFTTNLEASGNGIFGGNIAITAGNKIQLSGAGDATHHIYHSAADDYDKVNYSTGFQFEHYQSGVQMTVVGSNGRVGIGTTSPASLLHIQGSTYNRVQTYFSGSYISGFKFSDLNGGIWYDAGADDLYLNANHANSQVILQSGGSTTLTLDASNNATFAGTVQTTQITATNGLNYLKRNTDASLQLRSENTRSGLFITKPATDTVMGSALVLADESYRLGTANHYHMYMLQNGNTYFTQNVGIGTTSPTTQLHLKRTSGDVRGIMVETTVATSYAEVQLKAAREFRIGTGGSSTSANAASAFYVYDATAGGTAGHRFEISSAGDVQGRRVRSNTAGDVALSLQPTDSTIHYGFRIDSSTNSFNLDRVDSASQLLRVTATGNVGINCTPSYKLQWSDGTRTGLLDTNIGAVVIGSVSNDALAFYTNLTEKMRIDSSGSVGIGTNNPDARFSAVSSSANSTVARIGGIEYSGNQRGLTIKTFQSAGGDDCGVEFNAAEALSGYGSFIFKADTAERMHIDSSGNISLNGGLLGLGNAASTPNIGYGMFHYSGIGLGIYSSASGSTQGIGFWLNNGSAYEAARFLSNGNLGIGTTSPLAKLQVGTQQNFNATGISLAAGASVGNLIARTTTHHNWFPYTDGSNYYSADNHIIRNASHSTEWMRVNSSGNVGIGTTSPSAKLSIYKTAFGGDTAGSGGTLDFGVGSTKYWQFRLDSSSSGDLAIDKTYASVWSTPVTIQRTTGNIGIGTASPAQKVHLLNGGFAYMRFTSQSYGATGFDIGQHTNGTIYLNNRDNTSMVFMTNNAERMRITSSGNVGIDVSAPDSYNSSARKLVVGGSGDSGITISTSSTNMGTLMFADGTGGTAGYRGRVSYHHNGDYMRFDTAASARMYIDTFGNVAIGSTTGYSPNLGGAVRLKLTYNANENSNVVIENQNNGTSAASALVLGSYGADFTIRHTSAAAGGDLIFSRGTNERMRIDSSGKVGIGLTNPSYQLHVGGSAEIDGTLYTDRVAAGIPMPSHIVDAYSSTSGVFAGRFVYAGTSGSDCAMLLRLAGGSTAPSYVDFIYGSVQTGYITTNGSATFYGSASDYRLKENVVELNGALDRLDNLQPKRFNFTSTPEQTVDGFLAHEVADVVPEAIHGEKDAVNEDGEIIAQGIDQAKLVPLLVAAVQELRAEVKYLKDEINKLK